jgi:hypothetical protein
LLSRSRSVLCPPTCWPTRPACYRSPAAFEGIHNQPIGLRLLFRAPRRDSRVPNLVTRYRISKQEVSTSLAFLESCSLLILRRGSNGDRLLLVPLATDLR